MAHDLSEYNTLTLNTRIVVPHSIRTDTREAGTNARIRLKLENRGQATFPQAPSLPNVRDGIGAGPQ